jgi:DNA invertase Pin-like site-specific DNA recombinase
LGYARVSTTTQDLARQIDALIKTGIDPTNVYVDEKLGPPTERSRCRRCWAMPAAVT